MSVKQRLIQFAKSQEKSVRAFEVNCGLTIGYINAIRVSISPDKMQCITSRYPTLNVSWLMTGEGDMFNAFSFVREPEAKPISFSAHVPVKIVSTKARAGYSDSFYSDEYLETMPTVLMEADHEYHGKYLAFEVDGDSMEPDYNAGDVVICREIKRELWRYRLHLEDWDFVIAHGTKGIMLKQIIDHNIETGDIICHSVNTVGHPDFVLNLREVSFLYNVVEQRIPGKNKRRYR